MTDPSLEAFAVVAGLIALITDAKACGKRLAELQAQTGAATASQAARSRGTPRPERRHALVHKLRRKIADCTGTPAVISKSRRCSFSFFETL
jgi:hypothetical protein